MDKPSSSRQSTHQPLHPNALPPVDDADALRNMSKALFAMRDALNKLSLALKDWQFEHDVTRRDNVKDITHSLLARLSAQPQNKPGQAPFA